MLGHQARSRTTPQHEPNFSVADVRVSQWRDDRDGTGKPLHEVLTANASGRCKQFTGSIRMDQNLARSSQIRAHTRIDVGFVITEAG